MLAPQAGVVRFSICWALWTSLLKLAELTRASFEFPTRCETLFCKPSTDSRAAAMPPMTMGRMAITITSSTRENPASSVFTEPSSPARWRVASRAAMTG